MIVQLFYFCSLFLSAAGSQLQSGHRHSAKHFHAVANILNSNNVTLDYYACLNANCNSTQSIASFADIFQQPHANLNITNIFGNVYGVEYTSDTAYTHLLTMFTFENSDELIEQSYACNVGSVPVGNTCQPCSAGTRQVLHECQPCAQNMFSSAGVEQCSTCQNVTCGANEYRTGVCTDNTNGYSCMPIPTAVTTNPRKILCLHGGGGTSHSMEASLQNYVTALPEYEFVFINGSNTAQHKLYDKGGDKYSDDKKTEYTIAWTNEGNNVWSWTKDGDTQYYSKATETYDGKTVDAYTKSGYTWWPETTTETGGAFLTQLNAFIGDDDYYAIIGFSQGAAAAGVYLTSTYDTFQKAVLFNGYIPSKVPHVASIVSTGSSSVDTLFYTSQHDTVIPPSETATLAQRFGQSQTYVDSSGGHQIPDGGASFATIVEFLTSCSIVKIEYNNRDCSCGTGDTCTSLKNRYKTHCHC